VASVNVYGQAAGAVAFYVYGSGDPSVGLRIQVINKDVIILGQPDLPKTCVLTFFNSNAK
jgi:hypothetical protein